MNHECLNLRTGFNCHLMQGISIIRHGDLKSINVMIWLAQKTSHHFWSASLMLYYTDVTPCCYHPIIIAIGMRNLANQA